MLHGRTLSRRAAARAGDTQHSSNHICRQTARRDFRQAGACVKIATFTLPVAHLARPTFDPIQAPIMTDLAAGAPRLASAGPRFRAALAAEKPLQIAGTINAYHARMAERVGFRAIYLSGGGVAGGSLGLPDLGISSLEDVLTDVERITNVCDLPLLVDVDTGFGSSAFNIARTVKSLIKSGAAAMHIEDQVGAKRCGHRPGKELVPKAEMVDRIKAAVDARTDRGFFIL